MFIPIYATTSTKALKAYFYEAEASCKTSASHGHQYGRTHRFPSSLMKSGTPLVRKVPSQLLIVSFISVLCSLNAGQWRLAVSLHRKASQRARTCTVTLRAENAALSATLGSAKGIRLFTYQLCRTATSNTGASTYVITFIRLCLRYFH